MVLLCVRMVPLVHCNMFLYSCYVIRLLPGYCFPLDRSNRIDSQTVFTCWSPRSSDGGANPIIDSYPGLIDGSIAFFVAVLLLYCFCTAFVLLSYCRRVVAGLLLCTFRFLSYDFLLVNK